MSDVNDILAGAIDASDVPPPADFVAWVEAKRSQSKAVHPSTPKPVDGMVEVDLDDILGLL